MRTGRKGLKQDRERIKRFPLPTLRSQASSYPLFDQEGSAICDLLLELFLKRRVLPFKDSTRGKAQEAGLCGPMRKVELARANWLLMEESV